jgi:hypothetical protein
MHSREERLFALDGLRFPTNGCVRNSVRPNHLFDHNCDHDHYFELPAKVLYIPGTSQ